MSDYTSPGPDSSRAASVPPQGVDPLPDPSNKPLLRVPDLLGVLPGMSRSALYDAVKRGDLPSISVGRRLYIPNAALRERLQLPPVGGLFVGGAK